MESKPKPRHLIHVTTIDSQIVNGKLVQWRSTKRRPGQSLRPVVPEDMNDLTINYDVLCEFNTRSTVLSKHR